MSTQLAWTGLFIFLVLAKFITGMPLELIGAIVMGIGIVLLWLNK